MTVPTAPAQRRPQLAPEEQAARRRLRGGPRVRAEVDRTLREFSAEAARLPHDAMRALLPALKQAERELGQQLSNWIETRPDGELRWTAHSYRAALAQIMRVREQCERALQHALEVGSTHAQHLALGHLTREIARFSRLFGMPREVSLDVAAQIATGRSYLIPRIRTSAARYGQSIEGGRPIGTHADGLRQRLTVDILKGAPLSETIDQLVRQGGPRGLVALRGVAGEEGAIVELIPEGLFARYRFWAERIVRTETLGAYNAQLLDGMHEAREQVPGIEKRWDADGSACAHVCGPLDGQVLPLETPFETALGPLDHPPAHPNCGCRGGAWHKDWEGIFAGMDRAPVARTDTPYADPPDVRAPRGNAPASRREFTNDPQTANPPNSRHYFGGMGPKSGGKDVNTMILPHVDVAADLAAIRSGTAVLGREPGGEQSFTVNDRTYMVQNGHFVPVRGAGFLPLDRGSYAALKILMRLGDGLVAERALDGAEIDPQQREAARRAWVASGRRRFRIGEKP